MKQNVAFFHARIIGQEATAFSMKRNERKNVTKRFGI